MAYSWNTYMWILIVIVLYARRLAYAAVQYG